MQVIETDISGVLILEPIVYGDERGFFMESYNQTVWRQKTGITGDFVQDNHSRSARGVLRGLHYQLVHPQGKLVRVTSGEVFDVAVDVRRSSNSFGKWVGTRLNEQNKRMLWIPPGFAHGFLVLSDYADFLYKTTAFYAPEYERTIIWNDPDLNIAWPEGVIPELSDKDAVAPPFKEAEVYE